MLDELAGEIADRRADVRVGDLPTLPAEPTQIDQLLQNLISNAIKFTDTEPVVEVSAERENSSWRFAIADNGIGIPPEQRERVSRCSSACTVMTSSLGRASGSRSASGSSITTAGSSASTTDRPAGRSCIHDPGGRPSMSDAVDIEPEWRRPGRELTSGYAKRW